MFEESAPVILGYIERILTKELERDPYTTKLGGKPCYFDETQKPDSTDLNCRLCNGGLFLFLQAYCPLVDLLPTHERVIQVYICPDEKCNKTSSGWRVLRFQTPIEHIEKNKSKEIKEEKSGGKILIQIQSDNNSNSDSNENGKKEKDDDWGESESETNDNNDNNSEEKEKGGWGVNDDDWGVSGDSWGVETESSSVVDQDMEILLELRNASLQSTPKEKKKEKGKGKGKEKEKKVENLVTESKDQLFIGHLVTVEEEPYYKKSRKSRKSKKEKKKKSKGVHSDSEDSENSDDDLQGLDDLDDESNKDEWGDEEYESTQDKTFRRFCKRIELSPTQCLRYSFSGIPLLVSEEFSFSRSGTRMEKALQSNIPKCPFCDGRRVFEMQLLSTIIYLLKDSKAEVNGNFDFGTVLIYSCERSCELGQQFSEEYVHVQHA